MLSFLIRLKAVYVFYKSTIIHLAKGSSATRVHNFITAQTNMQYNQSQAQILHHLLGKCRLWHWRIYHAKCTQTLINHEISLFAPTARSFRSTTLGQSTLYNQTISRY